MMFWFDDVGGLGTRADVPLMKARHARKQRALIRPFYGPRGCAPEGIRSEARYERSAPDTGSSTMPMIRCTAKLLRKLGERPVAEAIAAAPSPLGDWYANFFTVERRGCIMFVNEKTLFPCVALQVTKAEYGDIRKLFRDLLRDALAIERFSEHDINFVLQLHTNLAIGKTQNRSTLGSLNNRISDAKSLIEYHGGLSLCDPVELARMLNDTPMSPIGYSSGVEEMRLFVAKQNA